VDPLEAKSIIEGILFVAGEPISVAQLAEVMEAKKSLVKKALLSLVEDYQERGLRIQYEGERVQMVTAPEMASCVERFLGLQLSGKLSMAALETLAIVAYRQPITRSEIESIRGVNCQGLLRNLMTQGLIEAVERLDTVGRPLVYGTTFEFLQYFGLENLAQLPTLGEEELADET
jgi:segregation and condensation protein B